MFGSILEESGALLSIGVRSLKTCFTIGNPLGCRGSACVDVMSTLHGSAPSLLRRAEGCVPLEDPFIRIPSSHVGASEGLRSLFSYSSDPVFPLFSLQLRVLGDWYEFEYRLDHHCHPSRMDTFMTREFSHISIVDCHLGPCVCIRFRSRLSPSHILGGELEDD
ncbi:hypothetical protein AAG906_006207 [Vitis piasezkii]